MAHETYMTVPQAAEALGLKPDWVRKLYRQGTLTGYHAGPTCLLITRESVEARKQAAK